MANLDLESNQLTVLHLATFFEELKAGARHVVAGAGATKRGYFSPREEEATGELLVSYWHARNALFDLITTLRRAPALPGVNQDRAFLIGFAAALLLVDAARFLREAVEARPLVKRKLNEPISAFGVPAGVYDTIQKSLLSARHGWHLYYSVKYFEEHKRSLEERAEEQNWADLLSIIHRLRHQLDVPIAQFASAKLSMRSRRIKGHVKHTLFGRALFGLQKLMGTLVADKYLRLGHQPALPPGIAAEIQGRLRPGDVLAVRKEYALTNYFLPGYWPHVALYLGPVDMLPRLGFSDRQGALEPQWRHLQETSRNAGVVIESMRDGVQLRSLTSPFGADSIVVLRPRLVASDVTEALSRSLNHHGKPYDFSFDFTRSDRLVCTEVVYRAYDGIGTVQMPLIQRMGRPTLSGNDLIGMAVTGEAFEPVAVYAPMFSSQVARGDEARQLIRQAQKIEPPEN